MTVILSNDNLAESESFKSTPANDNVKDLEIIVPNAID